MIVRRATAADRPVIDAFAALAVHDTYDRLVDAAYAQQLLDDWWGDALDTDIAAGNVHIAVDGDEVIGLAQVGTDQDTPVLWKLYVHPSRRSAGIGVALIESVIAGLPDADLLVTEHIAANADAARFYDREGFEYTRTDHQDDPRQSTVWRTRRLRHSPDPYEAMAEFHDLFMDAAWERIRPAIERAFGALPANAVVVDLGAGAGVGTRVLARSTPAQIVAIEPSLTMRAVLTARVADDTDLSTRVSVLAGSAPAVLDELTGPIAGFVCAHMLGHLSPANRSATFDRLARMMTVESVGLVVVNPDDEPTGADSESRVEERRIGRLRYTARHIPTTGDDAYTSEYTVVDGDRVLRRRRFSGTWTTITLPAVSDDVARLGMTVEQVLPGVGIVRTTA